MDKRGIKRVFIVGGMVVAICIVLIFSITIMSDSSDKKVSDLLAAGNKYFSEMEYEQAIVAFMEALEIDPKCEEAYLALAEVYVTVEDYEAAYDILSQGIELTEAEELIVCLEEIQEDYAVSETASNVSQEASRGSKEEMTEEITKEVNKDDTNKDRTETVYNDDGTYHVDEYDASGNCVKMTRYNADGTIDWYETDEYEVNGNCVKTTRYNADGTISRYWTNEYDAKGNCVKTIFYNADGTINNYYTYEYDAKGNCIKETCCNADGTIDNYYTYEYDAKGNCIKTTCYNADGKMDYSQEYDADGNIKTQTSMYYDEILKINYYCIHEFENWICVKTTWYHKDWDLRVEIFYEYDDNGNRVREISYSYSYENEDLKGTVETKYEYDDDGNRVKQTVYSYDERKALIEKIEYNVLDESDGAYRLEVEKRYKYHYNENGDLMETEVT